MSTSYMLSNHNPSFVLEEGGFFKDFSFHPPPPPKKKKLFFLFFSSFFLFLPIVGDRSPSPDSRVDMRKCIKLLPTGPPPDAAGASREQCAGAFRRVRSPAGNFSSQFFSANFSFFVTFLSFSLSFFFLFWWGM